MNGWSCTVVQTNPAQENVTKKLDVQFNSKSWQQIKIFIVWFDAEKFLLGKISHCHYTLTGYFWINITLVMQYFWVTMQNVSTRQYLIICKYTQLILWASVTQYNLKKSSQYQWDIHSTYCHEKTLHQIINYHIPFNISSPMHMTGLDGHHLQIT